MPEGSFERWRSVTLTGVPSALFVVSMGIPLHSLTKLRADSKSTRLADSATRPNSLRSSRVKVLVGRHSRSRVDEARLARSSLEDCIGSESCKLDANDTIMCEERKSVAKQLHTHCIFN